MEAKEKQINQIWKSRVKMKVTDKGILSCLKNT